MCDHHEYVDLIVHNDVSTGAPIDSLDRKNDIVFAVALNSGGAVIPGC